MKPIHSLELSHVLAQAEVLIGSRLQEWQLQGEQVGLGLYKRGQLHWLWIDLRTASLAVMLFEDGQQPFANKKAIVKPIGLFVRSHILGLELKQIEHLKDYGRVFVLHFANTTRSGQMQFRLTPVGRNLILESEGKKISMNIPQDLRPVAPSEPSHAVRSPDELRAEWMSSQSDKKSNTKNEAPSAEKKKARILEAIRKLESEPAYDSAHDQWAQAGLWIQQNGLGGAPESIAKCLDEKLSLAKNIDRCFSQAKENRRKAEKRNETIAELQKQLMNIEQQKPLEPKQQQPQNKKPEAKRFRFKDLAGGFVIEAGRNAKENIDLLRNSQAWDYWLHLRDYPSSHGILRRKRGQSVPRSVCVEAARWLIEHSFGQKASRQKGNSFEIVMCEKRFVRPIPGDQLGRVTYHEAETFKVIL